MTPEEALALIKEITDQAKHLMTQHHQTALPGVIAVIQEGLGLPPDPVEAEPEPKNVAPPAPAKNVDKKKAQVPERDMSAEVRAKQEKTLQAAVVREEKNRKARVARAARASKKGRGK